MVAFITSEDDASSQTEVREKKKLARGISLGNHPISTNRHQNSAPCNMWTSSSRGKEHRLLLQKGKKKERDGPPLSKWTGLQDPSDTYLVAPLKEQADSMGKKEERQKSMPEARV